MGGDDVRLVLVERGGPAEYLPGRCRRGDALHGMTAASTLTTIVVPESSAARSIPESRPLCARRCRPRRAASATRTVSLPAASSRSCLKPLRWIGMRLDVAGSSYIGTSASWRALGTGGRGAVPSARLTSPRRWCGTPSLPTALSLTFRFGLLLLVVAGGDLRDPGKEACRQCAPDRCVEAADPARLRPWTAQCPR